MDNQPDFEPIIQKRLDELKSVPARNPQVASRARAHFLAQAVSASESQRRKGWGFMIRKQQFAMNLAMAILVIASLFVGGTTVKAAQDDLPNEPLYEIKILSEDVGLQLQNDPEAKVDRLMELTQTRVQEISQLTESGQTPPERVRLRLEQHIQQTLQLCSNMEGAKLDQKLLQLRDQLQQYEQDMQSLQTYATQDEQPVLESTRRMLHTQLQLVNDGLLNHESFRDTVRKGPHKEQTASTPSQPHGEQNGPVTSQPGNQGNGNGVGPNTNPGGQNPHITATPKDNGANPGNNAGGNDKDKDAKDKSKSNGSSGGKSKDKDHKR